MTWQRLAPRNASKLAVAGGVLALVTVFAMGFGLLFTRPVRGSGTGGIGQCPAVLFVAVTGSAEYPSDTIGTTTVDPATNLTVSPELTTVYNNMLSTAGGADIGKQVLLYQPNSLDVVTDSLGGLKWDDPSALLGGLAGALLGGAPGAVKGYVTVLSTEVRNALDYSVPQYLDTERDGVSELWSVFNTTRSTCANHPKFVLAGYSQGAMVVHDFLNQLAKTHDSAAQQAIIGAVLLGDPDRVQRSGVPEFGTVSNASYGVCHFGELLALPQCSTASRVQDVAPLFQSRTVSVCMYDDPVCDTSDFVPDLAQHWFFHTGSVPDFSAASAQSFVNLGKAIHGSYAYVQPAVLAGKLMGRFIAASV